MGEEAKTNVLLLRSTSRNFPLDIEPELAKAGYQVIVLNGLDEFISSSARSQPFLAVIEVGARTDVERAMIVYDWSEHVQPQAPGRYLLLMASKNLQLGERARNLGAVEVSVLPLPMRNLLFKLELQQRIIKGIPSSGTAVRAPEGFSAQVEEQGQEHKRVLVIRGPGVKEGQWKESGETPSGKIRWRWVKPHAKEAAGREAYSWHVESASAPRFEESGNRWLLDSETDDLVCLHEDKEIYSAQKKGLESKGAGDETKDGRGGGRSEPFSSYAGITPSAASTQSSTPEEGGRGPGSEPSQKKTATKPAPENAGESPTRKDEPDRGRPQLAIKPAETGESVSSLGLEEKAGKEEGPDSPRPDLLRKEKNQPPQRAGSAGPESPPEERRRAGEGEPEAQPMAVPSFRPQKKEQQREQDPSEPDQANASTQRSAEDEDGPLPPNEFEINEQKEKGKGETEAKEAKNTAKEKAPALKTNKDTATKLPPKDKGPSIPKSLLKFADPKSKNNLEQKSLQKGREAEPASSTGVPVSSQEAPVKHGTSSARPTLAMKDLGEVAKPSSAHLTEPAAGFAVPNPRENTGSIGETPHREPLKNIELDSRGAEAPAEPMEGQEQATRQSAESSPAETTRKVLGPIGEQGEVVTTSKAEPRAEEETKRIWGGVTLLPVENRFRPDEEKAEVSDNSYLKSRFYLLLTLQELSDRESSWHPVNRYRIYLSAQQRYYGIKRPEEVLPLWIYEGELAPEFIDEKRSWKFYDRLPVKIDSVEALPTEVLEYIYQMCGLPLPSTGIRPDASRPSADVEAAKKAAVAGKTRDAYQPEVKKKADEGGLFQKMIRKITGRK